MRTMISLVRRMAGKRSTGELRRIKNRIKLENCRLLHAAPDALRSKNANVGFIRNSGSNFQTLVQQAIENNVHLKNSLLFEHLCLSTKCNLTLQLFMLSLVTYICKWLKSFKNVISKHAVFI